MLNPLVDRCSFYQENTSNQSGLTGGPWLFQSQDAPAGFLLFFFFAFGILPSLIHTVPCLANYNLCCVTQRNMEAASSCTSQRGCISTNDAAPDIIARYVYAPFLAVWADPDSRTICTRDVRLGPMSGFGMLRGWDQKRDLQISQSLIATHGLFHL